MQRKLTLTLRTNPNRIPRRTNSKAVIHTVRRTNRHFVNVLFSCLGVLYIEAVSLHLLKQLN